MQMDMSFWLPYHRAGILLAFGVLLVVASISGSRGTHGQTASRKDRLRNLRRALAGLLLRLRLAAEKPSSRAG
jgi:hypothetical protein